MKRRNHGTFASEIEERALKLYDDARDAGLALAGTGNIERQRARIDAVIAGSKALDCVARERDSATRVRAQNLKEAQFERITRRALPPGSGETK